jgi:hypothetical protein
MDDTITPPTPEKPRKRAARGQKIKPKPEKAVALQRKPIVTNQNGTTGLGVPEAKATAIAACLAQGFSVNRIVKELGTSCHTVTAIARNRPELVEQFREITKRNWQTVAMLATGELIDRVPGMKDQGLAVAAAIATEKMELLAGGPTSRVEHSHKPSADEWADLLAGIPEADAKVIEVAPSPAALPVPDGGIGNAGKPEEQNTKSMSGVTVSEDESRHRQSPDSEAADRVKPPLVSTLVSIPPRDPPPPPGAGAGGGGAFASL